MVVFLHKVFDIRAHANALALDSFVPIFQEVLAGFWNCRYTRAIPHRKVGAILPEVI